MRQPEPTELGRVLSRHNGQIVAGGSPPPTRSATGAGADRRRAGGSGAAAALNELCCPLPLRLRGREWIEGGLDARKNRCCGPGVLVAARLQG